MSYDTASVPPPPTERETLPYHGPLEAAAGAIVDPRATFDALGRRPRVGWAVAVAAVVWALSSAAGVTAVGDRLVADAPMLMLGSAAALGVVTGLAALVVAAALVHAAGVLLGGVGSYGSVLTGLAFAQVPLLLALPARLLPVVVGPGAVMATRLVDLVVVAWTVVLAVLAVRETHRLTTGRAVAAVLLPPVVLAGLAVLVAALITLLIAGLAAT